MLLNTVEKVNEDKKFYTLYFASIFSGIFFIVIVYLHFSLFDIIFSDNVASDIKDLQQITTAIITTLLSPFILTPCVAFFALCTLVIGKRKIWQLFAIVVLYLIISIIISLILSIGIMIMATCLIILFFFFILIKTAEWRYLAQNSLETATTHKKIGKISKILVVSPIAIFFYILFFFLPSILLFGNAVATIKKVSHVKVTTKESAIFLCHASINGFTLHSGLYSNINGMRYHQCLKSIFVDKKSDTIKNGIDRSICSKIGTKKDTQLCYLDFAQRTTEREHAYGPDGILTETWRNLPNNNWYK